MLDRHASTQIHTIAEPHQPRSSSLTWDISASALCKWNGRRRRAKVWPLCSVQQLRRVAMQRDGNDVVDRWSVNLMSRLFGTLVCCLRPLCSALLQIIHGGATHFRPIEAARFPFSRACRRFGGVPIWTTTSCPTRSRAPRSQALEPLHSRRGRHRPRSEPDRSGCQKPVGVGNINTLCKCCRRKPPTNPLPPPTQSRASSRPPSHVKADEEVRLLESCSVVPLLASLRICMDDQGANHRIELANRGKGKREAAPFGDPERTPVKRSKGRCRHSR